MKDRRPARDFVLDEFGERLGRARLSFGDIAPKLQQPAARLRVIERLAERRIELVDTGLGVPLGANSAFQAET